MTPVSSGYAEQRPCGQSVSAGDVSTGAARGDVLHRRRAADYEGMKARGAEFSMPPKDVTASKIAMLNDTCGNLIQLSELKRW